MPQRQLTTYQAIITQARAFRALRSFMGSILKSHNLTMTEWLIIGTVIDSGRHGVRSSELATILGVEMPVITNLVQKAVADGWLVSVPDETDKRAKRIVATPKGMEDVCMIEGTLANETQQFLGTMTKQAVKGYFSVIGALAESEPVKKELVYFK